MCVCVCLLKNKNRNLSNYTVVKMRNWEAMNSQAASTKQTDSNSIIQTRPRDKKPVGFCVQQKKMLFFIYFFVCFFFLN